MDLEALEEALEGGLKEELEELEEDLENVLEESAKVLIIWRPEWESARVLI